MNAMQKTGGTKPKKLRVIQTKKKLNEHTSTKLLGSKALALLQSQKKKIKKDLTLSHSTKTNRLIPSRAIQKWLINQINKPI